MLGLKFSILAICLTLSLQWIGPVDSKVCETHDKKIGKCLRPRDCPALKPIAEKLKKHKTLTDEEQRIKDSILPCEGRKKFCCEEPLNSEGFGLLKENDNICGNFVDNKVVNGKPIRMGSRPWMALLEYNETMPIRARFQCGGTLITSKFVLTAAHCIRENLVSVRLGEHDLSKDEDCYIFGNTVGCLDRPLNVAVEKKIPHPQFDYFYLYNDIALLRLKDPVQFTDTIRPICLPLSLELQLESQNSTAPMEVVGWGLTGKKALSNIPIKGSVNRLPLTQCNIFDITDKRICASANKTDACQGDSGGPLAYDTAYNGKQRWVQAGIVSYSDGTKYTRGKTHHAFYTDVAEYMGWITETIVENE